MGKLRASERDQHEDPRFTTNDPCKKLGEENCEGPMGI